MGRDGEGEGSLRSSGCTAAPKPVGKPLRSSDEQDDDEAVEWFEVKRLVFERTWGPILALPATKDDFFSVQRVYPFDQLGYALAKAKQKEREALWTFEMVFDRLPSPARYRVMKQLKQGTITPESCIGDIPRAAVLWSKYIERGKDVERLKRSWWRARIRQVSAS